MARNNQTKFKETEIGPIPEEWAVVNLGKEIEIIDGDRGNNYPNGSDFSNCGYCLFLNTKNVPGDTFDFSECQFITKEKDLNLRKGKMRRNDFVLTTRGTVGNVAYYDSSVRFENIRINSGMVILRNSKFGNEFLLQFLKSKIARTQFLELTSGSAQPQLPIKDLKNLKIVKPSIDEQTRIADMLGTLDEKIELNRRMNENLEKIASAIFKHWFVDFEFPNEQGKPYKASGGKMIDSELGLIPEVWKVITLKDIFNISGGGTPRTDNKSYWSGIIPFFTPKDTDNSIYTLKTQKNISEAGLKNCNSKLYQKNTTFITARGTVGAIALAGVPIAMNQSCYAILGKAGIGQYFTFLQIKNSIQDLTNKTHGSVFQTITTETFNNSYTAIPNNKQLINLFETMISPLFDRILNNSIINEKLSQIRDSLLPRLMSGKIRVH